MATPTQSAGAEDTPHDMEEHRGTYQSMMDIGFIVGLPVGGAITLLVALLLGGTGVLVSLVLAFFAWLGLLGIAKTFFAH